MTAREVTLKRVTNLTTATQCCFSNELSRLKCNHLSLIEQPVIKTCDLVPYTRVSQTY